MHFLHLYFTAIKCKQGTRHKKKGPALKCTNVLLLIFAQNDEHFSVILFSWLEQNLMAPGQKGSIHSMAIAGK